MKKGLLIMLFLLVLAATVGCRVRDRAIATVTAQAQPPAAGGAVLFQDDFQDGQPDDWQITAAWYVQQEGNVYYFNAAGQGGAWVPGGGNWADYEFQTTARVITGGLALSYRVTREGRYLLHFRQDGLYLSKEYPKGNYTSLTQTSAPSLNTWHQITIAGYGGHLQVYVDRALQLDYTDPSPLLQGTIGVGTPEGAQAAVDDVLVTRLTAALPAPAPAALPATAPPPAVPPPAEEGLPLEEVPLPGEEVPPAEEIPPPAEIPPAAGLPVIDYFYSEVSDREGCHYLHWDLHDAAVAYLNGQGVVAPGSEEVCPEATTTYTLRAENDAGSVEESLIIEVGGGPATGQPDLTLGPLSIWSPIPTEPGNVQIEIPINNIGDGSAGAFTVRWYPHQRTDEVGCSIDIDGLPANSSQIQNCSYSYPGHGEMHWWAIADADNDIQNELSEENNEQRGTVFIEAGERE